MTTRRFAFDPALAVPLALFLAIGFLLFASAGHDDAHITYWPAWTLLEHGAILNYNGERIEQSSSLLQVLLVALGAAVTGADVTLVGRVGSIVAGALTVLATQLWTWRVAGQAAAVYSGLLVATALPFVYWSFGGLDASLFTLGIALVLMSWSAVIATPARRAARWAAGAATLFAAMSRPEAPAVLVCMLLGFAALELWRERRGGAPLRRAALAVLGATVLGAVLALLAFRLAYFGAAVPNAVGAKVAGLDPALAALGWDYLATRAWRGWLWPIVTLAVLGAFAWHAWRAMRAREPAASEPVLGLAFCVAYLAFIVLAGGDWMGGWRFIAHFAPVALALLAVALAGSGWSDARQKLAVLALVLVQLVATAGFARHESLAMPAWTELPTLGGLAERYGWFERRSQVNVRDMPVYDRVRALVTELHPKLGRPVVILTGQGGFVAFHLSREFPGRLHFIDRWGLTERQLVDCPVLADLPRHQLGLQLSYPEYFARAARIHAECGVPVPDVIYDLRDPVSQQIEAGGYPLLYFQDGWVMGHTKEGFAVPLHAWQFVAVRKDLVPLLADARPFVGFFEPRRRWPDFLEMRLPEPVGEVAVPPDLIVQ